MQEDGPSGLTGDKSVPRAPSPERLLGYDAAVILQILLAEVRRINTPKWMTPEIAAAYTGFCVAQIGRLRDQGKLKAYYAPGVNRPRYKKEDLDELLENGSKK
jgi:Helix-turn-helix domain